MFVYDEQDTDIYYNVTAWFQTARHVHVDTCVIPQIVLLEKYLNLSTMETAYFIFKKFNLQTENGLNIFPKSEIRSLTAFFVGMVNIS